MMDGGGDVKAKSDKDGEDSWDSEIDGEGE